MLYRRVTTWWSFNSGTLWARGFIAVKLENFIHRVWCWNYNFFSGMESVLNPLNPNISIQILQTDLYTFPYRIRRSSHVLYRPYLTRELNECEVRHLNQWNLTVEIKWDICCTKTVKDSTWVRLLIQTSHFTCAMLNAWV